MNRALPALFCGEIPNTRSKKRLNIKYIPLGAQGMLVKNVTIHNALHFEPLKAMHQIGCCLARSLQARSLRQQLILKLKLILT